MLDGREVCLYVITSSLHLCVTMFTMTNYTMQQLTCTTSTLNNEAINPLALNSFTATTCHGDNYFIVHGVRGMDVYMDPNKVSICNSLGHPL